MIWKRSWYGTPQTEVEVVRVVEEVAKKELLVIY